MTTPIDVATANDVTFPGEYARWLEHNKMKPGVRYQTAIRCWAVINDQVQSVELVGIRGGRVEWLGHDYADLADGRSISTFYLFPRALHHKPELLMIQDEHGTTRQWVARMKGNRKWPR